MTKKLTAIIPTLNEEANIKGALNSVQFADEIIVVDSYSTDSTIQIVQEYPQVKVLQRKFDTHAKQKNWAISKASHDWIFILDADERTNLALINEIKEKQNTDHPYSAFWIGRENVFMGEIVKHVWKGDKVIRLFNRNMCRYPEVHVHEEIISTGPIGELSYKILHDTYASKGINGYLEKSNHYATLAALDRVNKIDHISFYHLLLKPFGRFMKKYVLSFGFLDGKIGFIISCLSAWNVFIRNVKIWRMKSGEKFKK